MHATSSGRQTATNDATVVTFTAEECDQLFNGYIVTGLFDCADEITTAGRLNRENLDRVALAVRVADAIGVQGESGARTIDDPQVIEALRDAVASELDGLLGDDEYDGHTDETRPIGISIERKLGVDRFAIAKRNGVPIAADGSVKDRRDSLNAQRTIAYYVKEALTKAIASDGAALDRWSRPLIVAIAAATVEAGGDRYDIEVPA